jgi:hypothetical protein
MTAARFWLRFLDLFPVAKPVAAMLVSSWILGCGSTGDRNEVPSDSSARIVETGASGAAASSRHAETLSNPLPPVPATETATPAPPEFKPLSLGNVPSGAVTAPPKTGTTVVDTEQQLQEIIRRLQPLQVLLGRWRGTTRREYENFKAVDAHEWVWDLRTNPEHPALVLQSDKSPYLRTARLSWDPETRSFTLRATDGSGTERVLAGDFTEPVQDVVGPDDKLHRVYRLELTESAAAGTNSGGEQWQLAFVQQENNRYLLEVFRRRGSADFNRIDTVSTQREGTSFAVSDSGYGDKTCIISEGLGTIEVTFQGRSYWVCCSGCKAAFEAEPETWIARAAQRASK